VGDAAVIFIDMMDALKTGGTGAAEMSVAAILRETSSPLHASSVWIGTRRYVEVESMSIDNGIIRVTMRRDDISEAKSFRLENEGLVEI